MKIGEKLAKKVDQKSLIKICWINTKSFLQFSSFYFPKPLEISKHSGGTKPKIRLQKLFSRSFFFHAKTHKAIFLRNERLKNIWSDEKLKNQKRL